MKNHKNRPCQSAAREFSCLGTIVLVANLAREKTLITLSILTLKEL